MFEAAYENLVGAGKKKYNLLTKNPFGYFLSSMVAGMFIAFGTFISNAGGAYMDHAGAKKLVISLLFAAALSLVISCGSELFTGNAMVMAGSSFRKEISWANTCKLLVFCYLGNIVGSWISVIVYHFTGLDQADEIVAQYTALGTAKVSAGALQLTMRGILCNVCVCLAVWCSLKLKSESAQLIMVFWAIMVFMVCGFEHSIANMSSIGEAMIVTAGSDSAIAIGSYIYNLFFVTLGNLIGAIVFVAYPYHKISSPTK